MKHLKPDEQEALGRLVSLILSYDYHIGIYYDNHADLCLAATSARALICDEIGTTGSTTLRLYLDGSYTGSIYLVHGLDIEELVADYSSNSRVEALVSLWTERVRDLTPTCEPCDGTGFVCGRCDEPADACDCGDLLQRDECYTCEGSGRPPEPSDDESLACPKCGSLVIDGAIIEGRGIVALQKCRCKKCSTQWTDIFRRIYRTTPTPNPNHNQQSQHD